MAEQKWEKQLMEFIKRTGDEIKRTGEEIKVEAQRLLDEVRDPARQTKVKESLKDLRGKASAMTKDAAEKIETVVRNIEDAVENAFDRNKAAETSKAPPAGSTASEEPASKPKPARKAGKTIGKKAGAKKASGASPAAKKAPAKKAPKSIGRKKPSA
jgi:hypothetical protein